MTSKSGRWLDAYRTCMGAMLGVLFFFTFGITLSLFRALPSQEAGDIAGILFPAYYRFLYALAGVSLICLGVARSWITRYKPALLSLLLAILLIGLIDWMLAPAMAAAKAEGQRAAFSRLHGLSMLLNFIAMAGAIAATILPRVRRELS